MADHFAIDVECMSSLALKYLGFFGELATSICLMCHNAVQYSESPVVNLTLQQLDEYFFINFTAPVVYLLSFCLLFSS